MRKKKLQKINNNLLSLRILFLETDEKRMNIMFFRCHHHRVCMPLGYKKWKISSFSVF